MHLVWRLSLILCTYGFLREMRPSEPFVTEFLSGEWRNVTSEQLNRFVYPVGTYSYLAQLFIVFLVTDLLRYKPLIIVSACAGVILWCLLLWTSSLEALQVVQFFYGTFMATEVAYYTYMYAKVDKEHYQTVTGNARAAMLAGRFTGGVVAQLMISFKLMDFRELNYISLAAQIGSLFWSFTIPNVNKSLYFYRQQPQETKYVHVATIQDQYSQNSQDSVKKEDEIKLNAKNAVQLLWRHFKTAYTDRTVLQWSIWWALATCGFLQVVSYVQLLWQEIEPDRDDIYNGAIEAALTLFGAAGALVAGSIRGGSFGRWGMWALTICSALEGGVLLLATLTDNIWMSYIGYILFGILYQFMITVCSAEVAKNLEEDSYGLVFGINTLLALILQSLLTLIVISESVLGLDPIGQFIVYGGYYIVLSVLYGIVGLIQLVLPRNMQSTDLHS